MYLLTSEHTAGHEDEPRDRSVCAGKSNEGLKRPVAVQTSKRRESARGMTAERHGRLIIHTSAERKLVQVQGNEHTRRYITVPNTHERRARVS